MSQKLFMSLVLATGILASTGVALLAEEGMGFAVVAPLIMAATVLVAAQAGRGSFGERRRAMIQASILAGSVVVASLIVVFANPEKLALVMPVLGVAAAAPVLASARRCETDGR